MEAIMTTSSIELGHPHLAWNKGRLLGQKRPLRPKDVWAIRIRLQLEGRKRFSATNRLLANERDDSDILFRHPRVVDARKWVSETMRVQHENHLHGSRRHAFCVQRLGA